VAKSIPNLWLSPPVLIPQSERQPWSIYNYSYSGLNAAIIQTTPLESMQFGAWGFLLLHEIVRADPLLDPVSMAKTDLSDAYMRVWLALKDVPKLAFVIPSVQGQSDV